jgi:cell division transport system ATP-binding protein
MNLFDQLNRMGTTIVIATHNEAMIQRFAHTKLELADGGLKVVEPKNKILRKLEGAF